MKKLAGKEKDFNRFRLMLKKSLLLTKNDMVLFDSIPDAVLNSIFMHNFNGSIETAQKIFFNKYDGEQEGDRLALRKEKLRISNLLRSVEMVKEALKSNTPVIFVTDNDNDGSLSQSIANEFVKILPKDKKDLVRIEFAQPIGASRGLTKEVVNVIVDDMAGKIGHEDNFVVITADNGIDNNVEVERIKEEYKGASVIITDHHLPGDNVVKEDERTIVFNPKYKPTDYFKKKNISGADTLGVLLTETANAMDKEGSLDLSVKDRENLNNMVELGLWANLIDYANADISDMPNEMHVIQKALDLRPLMNVSNSVKTFVTGDHSDAKVSQIETLSNGKIDHAWLEEKVESFRCLNVVARKILTLHKKMGSASDAFTEKDFHSFLAEHMCSSEEGYQSVNPNYIEQLRPLAFTLEATGAQTIFSKKMLETIKSLYATLKKEERDIIDALRESEVVTRDVQPKSAIIYPLSSAVTSLFNRKLLNKAYNESNPGFRLVLSDFSDYEVSGSMRSIYPMSLLLKGKEDIEGKLGVTVSFQGHEMAAGFFIKSTNGDKIDSEKLSAFNIWMSDRVEQLEKEENIYGLQTIEVSLENCGLVDKINRAVRANLAGMWAVPAILKLDGSKNKKIRITDSKTLEQLTFDNVVNNNTFGYQPIKTNFDGAAVVMPVETMRDVVKSNYTRAVRLSYMDSSVFMASESVPYKKLKNVTKIGAEESEEKRSLAKYYKENFSESNFMSMSRKDFQDTPYFRYGKHGTFEFNLWESLILDILDKTENDMLCVIDVEATGLGKAPKCFNIGGAGLKQKEGSGKTMNLDSFEKRLFVDRFGKEFLLSQQQVKSLLKMYDDESEKDFDSEETTVLRKSGISSGMSTDCIVYPGPKKDLRKITNKKVSENDKGAAVVLYNREVDAIGFSFLVNNNDVAVTPEFEALTGITTEMVKLYGKTAATVDEELTTALGRLKNSSGEPMKIIFQAHNMPYDKGVTAANFSKLNDMMDGHTIADTAKIAKNSRLAYDNTPVSSFVDVTGLPPKTYFYDSQYSSCSLSSFLKQSIKGGKSKIFPSVKGNIVLRYDGQSTRLSVINKKENTEILLTSTPEELLASAQDDGSVDMDGLPAPTGRRVSGQLPKNAVKYSVERLSSRAMIRNIILNNMPERKFISLSSDEYDHKDAVEMYQENYHFDDSPENNAVHFVKALKPNEKNRDMLSQINLGDVTRRFLDKNRKIQEMFHDGWIYEKVLAFYEPKSSRISLNKEETEQLSYLTDIPKKKVKEVCTNIVNFMREHDVDKAFVHEQHNNIRLKSDDGHGLADVVYEAVLPQLLGIFKFYNPYSVSVDQASDAMISQNIRQGAIQSMVNYQFKDNLARDSYSTKQMVSFHRQSNTEIVRRAKKATSVKDESSAADVKFKLSTGILPAGLSIMAKPKGRLSQEQIASLSEDIESVVVQEQILTAANGSSIPEEYGNRVYAVLGASHKKLEAAKLRVEKLLSRVEIDETDKHVAKAGEVIKTIISSNDAKTLPKSMPMDDDLLKTVEDMAYEAIDLCSRSGGINSVARASLDSMLTHAKELNEAYKAKKSPQKGYFEDVKKLQLRDTVRSKNFLPYMNIRRQDPLKFMMKTSNIEGYLDYVRRFSRADLAFTQRLSSGKQQPGENRASCTKVKKRAGP